MTLYRQKQRFYLTLIILSTIISSSIAIGVFFIPNFFDWAISVSMVTLIIAWFIIGKLKAQFDTYIYLLQKEQLFTQIEPPLKSSYARLDTIWTEHLTKKGYALFEDTQQYVTLYRVEKTASKKHRTLFLVMLIKNESLTFEDEQLIKATTKLENAILQAFKYHQRVYMQFKTTKLLTDEKMASTLNVLWLKRQGQNFVEINGYHSQESKNVYVPYSKKFYPTPYYEYAVEELSKIIL